MTFVRILLFSLLSSMSFDPVHVFASGRDQSASSRLSVYSDLLHAVNQRNPLEVSVLLNRNLLRELSRDEKLNLLTQVVKLAVIRASAEEHASSITILNQFLSLDEQNGFSPEGWNPFQSPQIVRYDSSFVLPNECAVKAMEMVVGLIEPSQNLYPHEYKNEVILKFSEKYPSLGNDLRFARHLGWHPLILQNIDTRLNPNRLEAEYFLAWSLTSDANFEITQKLLNAGVRYSVQHSPFSMSRIPVLCAAFLAHDKGHLKQDHLVQLIRDRDLDVNEQCHRVELGEFVETPMSLAVSGYARSLNQESYEQAKKLLSLVLSRGGNLTIYDHLQALERAKLGEDETMIKRLSQNLPKEWFDTPMGSRETGANREFHLFPGTSQAHKQKVPVAFYNKIKTYHRAFTRLRLVKELVQHKVREVDAALKRHIHHQTELAIQNPTLNLPLANVDIYISSNRSLVYLAAQKLLESESRVIKRKRDEVAGLNEDQEHAKRRHRSVSIAN